MCNLCPEYLSSLVPTNVGSLLATACETRMILGQSIANTQLYFNSFPPSVVREWNALPCHVQDSPTLLTFKNHMNSNLSSPPLYYYTGNRPSQIYHTRIRIHCSALNQYLFSKNIITSPLCDSGGLENARHFLLECALYQDIRRDVSCNFSYLYSKFKYFDLWKPRSLQ